MDRRLVAWIGCGLALMAGSQAAAQEGFAVPWQLGFQNPAAPVMERLNGLHDYMLVIITCITLFVLALVTYICLRFSRRRNPVASKTTHNTLLEVVWTVIPVIILVFIAIPSLKLHYFIHRQPQAEMTVKVVGYQWYWHYAYPDHGGFEFDSYIKKGADLQPGEKRLLEVDNRLVVPVDTVVRVELTAGDVIHAWAVPAFGIKTDAVPGRLNETWFKAERTGVFYGQCSELCGVNHGFMPIAVQVVSKEEFAAWTEGKKQASRAPEEKMASAQAKID